MKSQILFVDCEVIKPRRVPDAGTAVAVLCKLCVAERGQCDVRVCSNGICGIIIIIIIQSFEFLHRVVIKCIDVLEECTIPHIQEK
jgi:hypothetical protein